MTVETNVATIPDHVTRYELCVGRCCGTGGSAGACGGTGLVSRPGATVQLYINYRLKSVAHMPWRQMTYKFLNTIIDDLFAFVIKMPLMHRLSVFRDDVVFLIMLYQRWIYKVDKTRVNEFGFSGEAPPGEGGGKEAEGEEKEEAKEEEENKAEETKKDK